MKENHSLKKTVLATREETQPFWTQQVARPEEKRKFPRLKQQQIREETHRLVSRSARAQILFIFFSPAAGVKSASCLERFVWRLESTNEFVHMNILTSSYNNTFFYILISKEEEKTKTSSVRFLSSLLSAACKRLNTGGQRKPHSAITTVRNNGQLHEAAKWDSGRRLKKKTSEKNINSTVSYKHAHGLEWSVEITACRFALDTPGMATIYRKRTKYIVSRNKPGLWDSKFGTVNIPGIRYT